MCMQTSTYTHSQAQTQINRERLTTAVSDRCSEMFQRLGLPSAAYVSLKAGFLSVGSRLFHLTLWFLGEWLHGFWISRRWKLCFIPQGRFPQSFLPGKTLMTDSANTVYQKVGIICLMCTLLWVAIFYNSIFSANIYIRTVLINLSICVHCEKPFFDSHDHWAHSRPTAPPVAQHGPTVDHVNMAVWV